MPMMTSNYDTSKDTHEATRINLISGKEDRKRDYLLNKSVEFK